MNPDLDLTTRLDALGRALASDVPSEPPTEFLQGVHRQHGATLLKRTLWASLAGVMLLALAIVAYRSNQHPSPPQPRSPSYGDLRNVAPDDVDDAQLSPGTKAGVR